MQGNVIDLAVGVVIGASFGKITASLVNNIIMPPVGLLLSDVDFADLKWVLRPAAGNTPAVTMDYGVFINTVVDFLIVAFCIFLVIRVMNKLKFRDTATRNCSECLSTIPAKAVRCAHCASPQKRKAFS